MKKFLAAIVAILSFGLVFNSCLPPEVEVESVTLSKTSMTLTVGGIEMLTATVLPADATFSDVKWESSDPSVATIKDGFVVALKEGTAMITAVADGVTAVCVVTVAPQGVQVNSISLDKDGLEMKVGDLETITATVDPAGVGRVEWTSSNPAVAQVTSDGTVVAIAEGIASITASLGGKFASCPVTVSAGSGQEVTVTDIEIDVVSAEIVVDNTLQITVSISPAEAASKPITWTSSDSSVASIVNGLVTALKPGTVTITASCGGKTASCTLTVVEGEIAVTGVTVAPATLSLVEGGKGSLTAYVLPATATNKVVSWTSSDDTVATVDDNGEVTALKEGTAVITVTTVDGNKTATCEVTVASSVIPVTEVTIITPEIPNIEEGDVIKLTAKVLPEDATDKTVTWTSGNESIATVSQTGEVTTLKAGSVDIMASCGGKYDIFTLTIAAKEVPVIGVSVDPSFVTLIVGGKATVKAILAPENATNKAVTWSSDNEDVATVNPYGEITAKALGTTEITVTTEDGNYTASCRVKVTADGVSATGVSVSPSFVNIHPGENTTLSASVEPENATNKAVTWTSNDDSIATVDANGIVTAVALGNTYVTSTTVDGGFTDFCSIHVIPVEVTSVVVSPGTYTLNEGETVTLRATVYPENATDKTVTWSSLQPSKATVDENGVVTAKQAGTVAIMASCGGKNGLCDLTIIAPVKSVAISPASLSLGVGDVTTVSAVFTPSNATNKKITWSSSNPSVATIDQNGVVTAVRAGNTTITVTTEDGHKTATCPVSVHNVQVSSVSVTPTTLELPKGETADLIATVLPENATDKSITWSTSDASVATVSNSGKVTAVDEGTATITVKSVDGEKTATCEITVIIPVSSLSITPQTLELTEGESADLIATILPENATYKTVSWNTDDNNVVVVSKGGRITALRPGTAKITASTGNGLSASCIVTVKAKEIPVSSVSVSPTSLSLTEKETAKLTATVEPSNATNKNVTWSSNNNLVATVDKNGEVTAVRAGTATITVTTEDGEKKASCEVVVSVPVIHVSSISVYPSTLQMTEGDTRTLSISISPRNATDKSVTWSSNNTAVATVENGTVHAVGAGNATITVTTNDGEKTATCAVTVNAATVAVTGVSLNKTNLELTEGEDETLTATVSPNDATNKNVSWSTSDESVATVNNGTVHAVGAGNATITVTTEDGEKTATCAVTVNAATVHVTGVSLDKTTLGLTDDGYDTLTATVYPSDATDKSVTWSSSDESIATVENGTVYAVGDGSCTITVTTTDGGKTASCDVTVTVLVTGVSLDQPSLTLEVGSTGNLTATVAPDGATNKSVSWSTSNSDVATVNNGVVTAVAEGTATITVTTDDGGFTADCAVTVLAPVTPEPPEQPDPQEP